MFSCIALAFAAIFSPSPCVSCGGDTSEMTDADRKKFTKEQLEAFAFFAEAR